MTITGTRSVTVDDTPAAREAYEWTTRDFRIDCHTGRVIEGRWAGFPVVDLTAPARPSPETTHFVVSGADGHRACVPVGVISDALLAFDRERVDVTYEDADGFDDADGADVDGADDGTPRFLAQGVDSSHTVREVVSIEAVALDPHEDPRRYEITD